MQEYIHIRREILRQLYTRLQTEPPGEMAEDELASELELPLQKVRTNLWYLCKSNFVESHPVEIGTRSYLYATITVEGMNLLEAPSEFNKKFPPQLTVHYQVINGDNFQVKIGDNVSDVMIGKDIVSLQFGSSSSLEEACKEFLSTLQAKKEPKASDAAQMSSHIGELEQALQSDELDLGKIQRIKQLLAGQEGKPAAATAALFSHPSVVGPIERAVKNLVGQSDIPVAPE